MIFWSYRPAMTCDSASTPAARPSRSPPRRTEPPFPLPDGAPAPCVPGRTCPGRRCQPARTRLRSHCPISVACPVVSRGAWRRGEGHVPLVSVVAWAAPGRGRRHRRARPRWGGRHRLRHRHQRLVRLLRPLRPYHWRRLDRHAGALLALVDGRQLVADRAPGTKWAERRDGGHRSVRSKRAQRSVGTHGADLSDRPVRTERAGGVERPGRAGGDGQRGQRLHLRATHGSPSSAGLLVPPARHNRSDRPGHQ